MLEELGIEYLVGGSFASSLHGHPRSTQDIHFVADIKPEHVAPLVAALHGRFYFDEPAIRDAVSRRAVRPKSDGFAAAESQNSPARARPAEYTSVESFT